MAKTAQLTLYSERLPAAVAAAGSEADLYDALRWAQDALDPGELLRLRNELVKPDGMPRAVREIVTRWRQFQALAGCDPS